MNIRGGHLTEREERILKCIRDAIAERGEVPSIRRSHPPHREGRLREGPFSRIAAGASGIFLRDGMDPRKGDAGVLEIARSWPTIAS